MILVYQVCAKSTTAVLRLGGFHLQDAVPNDLWLMWCTRSREDRTVCVMHNPLVCDKSRIIQDTFVRNEKGKGNCFRETTHRKS